MPTYKPRIMLNLDDEMAAMMEDYRFEHRFRSLSTAGISLIKLGIKAFNAMTDEERKEYVEQCNREGVNGRK